MPTPSLGGSSGRYVNALYGYSLRIPPGLVASDNVAAPRRGIHLAWATAPSAVIDVDASYDTFYDVTAQAVQRRDLDRLHDQAQRLPPPQQAAAALAGVSGRRYTATMRCVGDPVLYVEDDVVVLRNREIYRVHLHTAQPRYSADVAVFEAVLKSWRWLPRVAWNQLTSLRKEPFAAIAK